MRSMMSASLSLRVVLAAVAASLVGCAHSGVPAGASTSANTASPVLVLGPATPHVVATDYGFALTERLEFDANRATLRSPSDRLVGEVAQVMKDNPTLLLVYVAGFASVEGDPERNRVLAVERARHVRARLVAGGVAPHRIVAGGFGTRHPVGDNDSHAGRDLNRRTELIPVRYIVNNQVVEGSVPTILSETIDVAEVTGD